MISKDKFIKTAADCYCQTPELIENYEQAIADTTRIWNCHHRDEIRFLPSGMTALRSKDELIENGRYFNCPPNELIFLPPIEHIKLHSKFINHPKATEETKKKMSIARKAWKITEETKKKLSIANKGKPSKLKNTYKTEFGKKYFEKFGYGMAENKHQYAIERQFYVRHGYCRWEKEE